MRLSTFALVVLAMAVGGYIFFRASEWPAIREPTPILARR